MLKPNIPVWKIIVIALLIVAALFINFWFMTHARSEDVDCWILCQPDSFVYARSSPNKKSMELGRLECGDRVCTDGKTKNGFIHLIDLNFEMCEGWVHKGYIVYDEPRIPFIINTHIKSNGRVAARKTIGGDRRCWLTDGQSIKVYMMSENWAVTNKGFVKSKFIEIGR